MRVISTISMDTLTRLDHLAGEIGGELKLLPSGMVYIAVRGPNGMRVHYFICIVSFDEMPLGSWRLRRVSTYQKVRLVSVFNTVPQGVVELLNNVRNDIKQFRGQWAEL